MFVSRRGILWAVAVVLSGVGGVLVGVGLASQQHAPQPTIAQADPAHATPTIAGPSFGPAASTGSSSARSSRAVRSGKTVPTAPTSRIGISYPTPTATSEVASTRSLSPLVLPASVPLSIAIPSIGVQSTLLQLGLNPDNSIQVPPLDAPDSKAGWYKYSPTPGQLGPTVILGHVDSAKHGPAVFFRLGALQPGAAVEVTRSDGTVAVFIVDKVVAYSKSAFPTGAVYGNIDRPGLRLITCGGTFDPAAGSYESSIVAYASLASSHPVP